MTQISPPEITIGADGFVYHNGVKTTKYAGDWNNHVINPGTDLPWAIPMPPWFGIGATFRRLGEPADDVMTVRSTYEDMVYAEPNAQTLDADPQHQGWFYLTQIEFVTEARL